MSLLVLGLQAGSGSTPWSGPQVPTKTLKEIQEEEARARQQHQQQPAAAAHQDDDMLWDYGGSSSSAGAAAPPPPPPPMSRPPGMPTAAAVAAKGLPAAAAPAAAAGKGAWTTVAGPAGTVAKGPAVAVVGAARPNGVAVVATVRPGVAPAPVRPAQPAPAPAPPPIIMDGSSIMFRDQPLSTEFHDWCKDQVKRLLSTDDMAMIEVLLSMDSRSEVAETCQLYMGNKPGERSEQMQPAAQVSWHGRSCPHVLCSSPLVKFAVCGRFASDHVHAILL